MASKTINITLKIWRQKNANAKGSMETYKLDNVSTDSSFLEMLDQLNEQLVNERKESCGGHFREEYQDAEGETLRDDENFKFVGAWEYKGEDINQSELHKEALNYEFIKIAARNYK